MAYNIQIFRLPDVLQQTGYKRSTLYARIRAGEFPRPIALGLRAVGWLSSEVEAVLAARIAGKSDEEIRALVVKLESARKAAA